MRILKYKTGHQQEKTVTVRELRALLEAYPDGLPVLATWEGVYASIRPQRIQRKKLPQLKNEEECLIIDVGKY